MEIPVGLCLWHSGQQLVTIVHSLLPLCYYKHPFSPYTWSTSCVILILFFLLPTKTPYKVSCLSKSFFSPPHQPKRTALPSQPRDGIFKIYSSTVGISLFFHCWAYKSLSVYKMNLLWVFSLIVWKPQLKEFWFLHYICN